MRVSSRTQRFLVGWILHGMIGNVACFQSAQWRASKSSLFQDSSRISVRERYNPFPTARLVTHGARFSTPALLKNPLDKKKTIWKKFRYLREKLLSKLAKDRSVLRRLVAFGLVLVFWLSLSQAAWSVTGGRVGGSFSRSSSPPIQSRSSYGGRSYSSRPYSSYRQPTYWVYPSSPLIIGGSPSLARLQSSQFDAPAAATKMTTSDVVLLTGTGALLTYGIYNNFKPRDGTTSALGPGATVASIVVAVNVPDQNVPNAVTKRLQTISDCATTGTRRGVQNLVTEVCLELLRQERSIVSAFTSSQHFGSVNAADRDFQSQSIRNRSKFDRENVNKFGSEDRSESVISQEPSVDSSCATSAIVSINIAIEGDSTKLPRIRNREDLVEALSKLASDAQVEECLLSAEILWSPNEPGEVLTTTDVYADYPDLVTI